MQRNVVGIATFAVLLIVFASSGCAKAWYGCVAAGTLIDTPKGPTFVEHLTVGDEVWSLGPDGGRKRGIVDAIRKGVATELIEFSLAGGRSVRVTPEHPVLTSAGWRSAASADAHGVTLATPEAKLLGVTRNRVRSTVYDLTIQPEPNFLAQGMVLHNKTVFPPPRESQLHGRWIAHLDGKRGSGTIVIDLMPEGDGRAFSVDGDGVLCEHPFAQWDLSAYRLKIRFQVSPFHRRHATFVGEVYAVDQWTEMRSKSSPRQRLYLVRASALDAVAAAMPACDDPDHEAQPSP